MGTEFRHGAFLVVMTTGFAALALDISVPAVVLSLLALSRTMVVSDFGSFLPGGETA